MKSFMVVCLFAVMSAVLAKPDHYTDRFDNINLDEILGNQRLFEGYCKCLLGEGKCTPEGKELKSHVKEALENDCAKCTDTQKTGTRRVIGHLINVEKDCWTKLKAKFDPEHKYVAKYESELRKVAA